jgi:hypothetical protein
MIMRSVFVAVCPVCGYDVARVLAAVGGFRVICDPEGNGCGAEGCLAPSEGEAVALWNRCPSPGARALTDAAKRRLGGGQ